MELRMHEVGNCMANVCIKLRLYEFNEIMNRLHYTLKQKLHKSHTLHYLSYNGECNVNFRENEREKLTKKGVRFRFRQPTLFLLPSHKIQGKNINRKKLKLLEFLMCLLHGTRNQIRVFDFQKCTCTHRDISEKICNS